MTEPNDGIEAVPDLVWTGGDLGYWVTDQYGRYFQPVARQEGDGSYDWTGGDGWPE